MMAVLKAGWSVVLKAVLMAVLMAVLKAGWSVGSKAWHWAVKIPWDNYC